MCDYATSYQLDSVTSCQCDDVTSYQCDDVTSCQCDNTCLGLYLFVSVHSCVKSLTAKINEMLTWYIMMKYTCV